MCSQNNEGRCSFYFDQISQVREVAEQRRVLLEIGSRLERNRVELVRAWLRIRDKQGRLVALEPNRAQREFERRYTERNIVLKARQLGITTWAAARFFVATITQPGTVPVQVAHDQQSAEAIFRIVHRFLENLPENLRKGALRTARNNVRQIAFPVLDSEYRVASAGDPDAGRGTTIRNLHASEVARWPADPGETLASLLAAVPLDGNVVLESTANGVGGCFYDEWQRADENGVTRHFYPWWYADEYCLAPSGRETAPLTPAEQELVAEHGLSFAQIAFRRSMQRRYGRLAPQEFAESAESCFLASGDCVFDVALITARLEQSPEPLRSAQNDRLQVWWPAAPLAHRRYVIGVDVASGSSIGDYSCAQIVDLETGLQCAELHGHLTPRELAHEVAQLSHEYHDALIAVERNNHGHAVLAHLEQSGSCPIYEMAGAAGWETNVATRPRAIEAFAALLAARVELFSSRRLLNECRAFVRRQNGSPAAAPGAHDDCVMAMAIAQAVRNDVLHGVFRFGSAPQTAFLNS